MNIIYKVIFNRLTGAFQAVSEVSRSRGKAQSCRLSAAMLSVLMGGSTVYAACTDAPFQAAGMSSADSLCIDNPAFSTELVGVHSGANLTLSNSTVTAYDTYAVNVSGDGSTGAQMASNNNTLTSSASSLAVVNVQQLGVFTMNGGSVNASNSDAVAVNGLGTATIQGGARVVSNGANSSALLVDYVGNGSSGPTAAYVSDSFITSFGAGGYGIFAKGAAVNVTGSIVEADGFGATGVYNASNNYPNAAMTLTNSRIIATGQQSKTVWSANGTITVDNSEIYNSGGYNSFGVAASAGTVIITNGSYITAENGSTGVLANGGGTVLINGGSTISTGANPNGVISNGVYAVNWGTITLSD